MSGYQKPGGAQGGIMHPYLNELQNRSNEQKINNLQNHVQMSRSMEQIQGHHHQHVKDKPKALNINRTLSGRAALHARNKKRQSIESHTSNGNSKHN